MIVRRKGGRNIAHKLENMARRIRPLLEKRLSVIGRVVLREIKLNLSNKILHKRSGRLFDSWNFRVITDRLGYRLVLGSHSDYARIHDLGGWTGRNHASKIPARRYARKAFTAKKREIRRNMEGFLAEWVK